MKAAEEKLAAGSTQYAKWKLDYDRARKGSRSIYEVLTIPLCRSHSVEAVIESMASSTTVPRAEAAIATKIVSSLLDREV